MQSSEPQWTLRLTLEDPFGRKSYSTAIPIDSFQAWDKYVGLAPPHEFDMRSFEGTVEIIKKREYRKDDFEMMARLLAKKLGERMEDEEGWHGVSRQEHYEQARREGRS